MTTAFEHSQKMILEILDYDQVEYDKTVGKMLGLFICINITNLAIKQTKIIPSGALSYFLGLVSFP